MFDRKPPVVIQIQMQASLTWLVYRDPEDGHYIGVCQALNLNAMGDTYAEFQQCANETIQLLLLDLLQEGQLEQFLRARHWQPSAPLPTDRKARIRFDVPFDLQQTGRFEQLVPA